MFEYTILTWWWYFCNDSLDFVSKSISFVSSLKETINALGAQIFTKGANIFGTSCRERLSGPLRTEFCGKASERQVYRNLKLQLPSTVKPKVLKYAFLEQWPAIVFI